MNKRLVNEVIKLYMAANEQERDELFFLFWGAHNTLEDYRFVGVMKGPRHDQAGFIKWLCERTA